MKRIVLVWLYLILMFSIVSADENRPMTLNNERIYQAVESYVQQIIQHNLVKTCGELMRGVNLMPDIAMQASQRAAMEVFKQEDLKSILIGIFDENSTQVKDEINMGMPQTYIELGVKKRIEKDIKLLLEDPVFRYIIEEMLKQAVVQQRQIIMMKVAEQQAQLLAIRQQQMILQQELMKQVMEQIMQSQFGK